ncbi:ABC transporter ATP-binding protein, partial [Aequitasia blattaphilus]
FHCRQASKSIHLTPYRGRRILDVFVKDLSFAVNRGETFALVGASGSGKTTIASLLARFWDISKGEITINGMDIRRLPMDTLMAQISMVFQKVYLFEDTIYNNIAMGRKDAEAEEIYEAAKKACCYDFIMNLPYGFDTYVGAGGATLSGGEAQRISIARCLLKDAPIVILDEATASIDADNESQIQAALSNLCQNKTTIVIAHRLNTIRNADRILLLDKGYVKESGTHEELLLEGGLYSKMVGAGGDAA